MKITIGFIDSVIALEKQRIEHCEETIAWRWDEILSECNSTNKHVSKVESAIRAIREAETNIRVSRERIQIAQDIKVVLEDSEGR